MLEARNSRLGAGLAPERPSFVAGVLKEKFFKDELVNFVLRICGDFWLREGVLVSRDKHKIPSLQMQTRI